MKAKLEPSKLERILKRTFYVAFCTWLILTLLLNFFWSNILAYCYLASMLVTAFSATFLSIERYVRKRIEADREIRQVIKDE